MKITKNKMPKLPKKRVNKEDRIFKIVIIGTIYIAFGMGAWFGFILKSVLD